MGYSPRLLVLHIGAFGVGGGIARVAAMSHQAWAGRFGGAPWSVDAISLLGDPQLGPPEWAPDSSYRAFGGDRLGFAAAALLAAREKHDVVVADHANILPLGGAVAALTGAPLVSWLYGIEVFPIEEETPRDPRESSLGRLRRAALRRADLLLAISAYTARRALEVEPGIVPPRVCLLAPHQVDSVEAEPDSGPEALIVGRMSRSERYKGHEEILRGWRIVRAAVPGARLTVIGDGDDRSRLEALARAAGCSGDEVRFLGTVDETELARAYARCRVFVMPSRGEGFGLVFCEASRFGRASIGHRVGPAAEILRDGETGWLVDGRSSVAVAGALVEALGNPAEARRRGAAARDDLGLRFRPELFAATLRGAIEELVGFEQGGG